MLTVDAAELKDHLDDHLARIRAGEDIIIRDHDQVVAKLSRFSDPDERSQSETGPFDPDEFFAIGAEELRGIDLEAASRAVSEDREERERSILGQ